MQSKETVLVQWESLPGAGWGHSRAAPRHVDWIRRGLAASLSPCGSEAGLSAHSRPDRCRSDLNG